MRYHSHTWALELTIQDEELSEEERPARKSKQKKARPQEKDEEDQVSYMALGCGRS